MDAIPRNLELASRLRTVARTTLLRVLGLVAATTLAVVIAAPAAATGTPSAEPTPTPLVLCGTLPLDTPCAPAITSAGGTWTLTIPGVGSLEFVVDPTTNQILSAKVSGIDAAFTGSLTTLGGEDGRISATFTNIADPTQVYTIVARVEPPATAGGTATVTGTVKSAEKDENEDKNDDKDDDKNDKHEQKGDDHHHGGGDHEGHDDK